MGAVYNESRPSCHLPVGLPSPCLPERGFNWNEPTAAVSSRPNSQTSIVDAIKLGAIGGLLLNNEHSQYLVPGDIVPPHGHYTPGVIGQTRHGHASVEFSGYDQHHVPPTSRGLSATFPNNVQDFRSGNIWKPTAESDQTVSWLTNAQADNQTVTGQCLPEYQPMSIPRNMDASDGYYFHRAVNTSTEILPKASVRAQRSCQPVNLNNFAPVRPILGSSNNTFGPPVTQGTFGHPGGYDGTTRHRQWNTGLPQFLSSNRRKQNPPTPDRTLWYHCDICDCNVNSEYQFKIHTEGIKHRKRLAGMQQAPLRLASMQQAPLRLASMQQAPLGLASVRQTPPRGPGSFLDYQQQISDPNKGPIQIGNSQELANLVNRMSSLDMATGCVSSTFTPQTRDRYDSDSEYFSGSDLDSLSVSSDI